MKAAKVCLLLIAFYIIPGYLLGQKEIAAPDTIRYMSGDGVFLIEFGLDKGSSFHHPTFALWIEDTGGNYLETLFVTRSIATGIYGHADGGDGTWQDEAGEAIRPAALPYWSHQRGIISREGLYVPTPEHPVTDALTGATPQGSFVIITNDLGTELDEFRIMFEINQPWDWNAYWTNNKFPEDTDYKTSAQPSVVYAADFVPEDLGKDIYLEPVGHGHYSGKDGSLTSDLSTLSTALQIAERIRVIIK